MKQNVKIVCILLELTWCALALPLLVMRNVKTHHSLIGLRGALESHLPDVGLPWFKAEEEEPSKPWAQSKQASREIFTLHLPWCNCGAGTSAPPECRDAEAEIQRLRAFLGPRLQVTEGRIWAWGPALSASHKYENVRESEIALLMRS